MILSFDIFGISAAGLLSELQQLSFAGQMEQVWTEEEFRLLLQGPGVEALVVCEKDQPIGFILSRRAAGEAEILSICVLPQYRKRGVGQRLLEKFRTSLDPSDVTELFLEVREHNRAAIALYERNGFHVVGRRKKYYGAPGREKQDALVMKKTIG